MSGYEIYVLILNACLDMERMFGHGMLAGYTVDARIWNACKNKPMYICRLCMV